jgi:hypothetical protein
VWAASALESAGAGRRCRWSVVGNTIAAWQVHNCRMHLMEGCVMSIFWGILKAAGLGILALIVGLFLVDAAKEGHSHLAEVIFGWTLALTIVAWCVTAVFRVIRKRRNEPISDDSLTKRASDWLLEHEPLVLLAYRISIVLLLALGIDKIDRHTWGVASQQASILSDIEARLTTIESSTSEIESNTSSIDSNTSSIESNTDRIRY